MPSAALDALHAVVGGALVLVFSLVGTVVRPKAFSGLFGAAPSVAVASLALTIAYEGVGAAGRASTGMVVGAIAMTACCIVAALTIPLVRALAGSLLAWLGWGVVGLGLYWALFVGAR